MPPVGEPPAGPAPGAPRRAWLFLGGTFAVTWVVWGALAALTRAGTLAFGGPGATALLVLGGSAPTWVAYLAVWRTPEAGPLREFNQRVLRLRVPIPLLVIAVLGAAALGVASMMLTGAVTEVNWPEGPGYAAALFVPAFVTGIALGGIEEVGWRGVLQPAVTARWSLLTANLVIALVWALWHLPLFWVAGGAHEGGSFALFLVAGVGYSAVMTWLYARTHSVALCVLFHAGVNAASAAGLAFTVTETPGFAVQAIVLAVVGTALLLVAQRH